MIERAMKFGEPVTVDTYEAVIRKLARRNDIEDAFELITLMQATQ